MSAVLSLDAVSVDLGGRRALENVSLQAAAGELVGILGPNGAGKTTLARALLGFLPLAAGRTEILRVNSHSLSALERARRAAYLPQARPVAWPISVRETVLLGRFAYGGAFGRPSQQDLAAAARAMAVCGVEALAERAVTALSGGEAARVHVARALAAETPALIADEPVAALDPLHQWRVMETMRAYADKGGAALVILHDISLAARFCTRLAFLSGGRLIADGSPEKTLLPDTLAQVYGVRAEIRQAEGAPTVTIMGPESRPPPP